MTPESVREKRLRWSHNSEAVEDCYAYRQRLSRLLLQWGHGSEAVDNVIVSDDAIDVTAASMGPRLGSRG